MSSSALLPYYSKHYLALRFCCTTEHPTLLELISNDSIRSNIRILTDFVLFVSGEDPLASLTSINWLKSIFFLAVDDLILRSHEWTNKFYKNIHTLVFNDFSGLVG